ncbi:MAG: alpha/beta hydrolase [Pseudomonadota bacterium]|nr:alpha/beta hydrolase [Pseudomonadota bacterium]
MQQILTPAFVEREYNNRALVPDHAAYFARWSRDSQFVRATLPCTLDVPYGPDARHRIDLFPAAHARGTLVFIHGGYWRTLDKDMFSWLAAAWVAAGVNVAIPNYRLAPAVRIDDIVDDVIAAMNWLLEKPGSVPGFSMDRVVVSGHSAGGHLTAALFAAPRNRLRFDLARIVGGVPISGVFDFAPLKLFSFNADFRLDDPAVARLSLAGKQPTIAAPLIVAAGAAESSEFQRQSRLLADAWAPQVRSLILLPGLHHFSVVDAFTERGQPLFESTLALFE